MKSSNHLALVEYQIRKPLNRDLRIEALPEDLREVVADLLCTISDAAHFQRPEAIAELRKIASKLAPKSTLKDPYQRDRPLVSGLIAWAKTSIEEDRNQTQFAVRALIDGLRDVDPPFGSLAADFVERAMRTRGVHDIAGVLTVECGAFGETAPSNRLEKQDAIERVSHLSLRAKDA